MPDMSPAAIDLRLREAAQLHRLGVALRSARRIGPVEKTALTGFFNPTSDLDERQSEDHLSGQGR